MAGGKPTLDRCSSPFARHGACTRTSFILSSVTLGSVAFGQVGTCSLTWQVSLDAGASWQSGNARLGTDTSQVRVRALLDWSQDAGYAFQVAQFDAIVRSMSQETWEDVVLSPTIQHPFDRFASQTLATSRWGREIKIDDSRDTFAPGVGTRGIFVSQVAEDLGFPFSRERPVSLFEFDLELDGRAGTRVIDLVFTTSPSGGSGSPQFFRGPRAADGINRPEVSVSSLTLEVIVPGPGWGGIAAGCVVMGSRRRRS
jgi:hypothetical protein